MNTRLGLSMPLLDMDILRDRDVGMTAPSLRRNCDPAYLYPEGPRKRKDEEGPAGGMK